MDAVGRSGRAGRRMAVAACLAMTGALLLPGAAAGRGGLVLPSTGSGPEFSLGKGPGPQLTVSTEGQKVSFDVARGEQSVDYKVRGGVARGGIRANLGHAGRVDVEFEPSGPPEPVEPLPFCKGRLETITHGVFVGAIDFVGRDHFADFHARRVPGTVSRPGRLRCHIPGGGHSHPTPKEEEEVAEKEVALSATSADHRLVFVALTDRGAPRPTTAFAAFSRETAGRILVTRIIFLLPSRPDFSFDEALTTATVAPPAPFHGSAVFQRGAAGSPPSWSGTLRVAFLDREMALTGAGFTASLGSPRSIGGGGSFRVP
jgi:hypothetical protein